MKKLLPALFAVTIISINAKTDSTSTAPMKPNAHLQKEVDAVYALLTECQKAGMSESEALKTVSAYLENKALPGGNKSSVFATSILFAAAIVGGIVAWKLLQEDKPKDNVIKDPATKDTVINKNSVINKPSTRYKPTLPPPMPNFGPIPRPEPNYLPTLEPDFSELPMVY